MCGCHFKCVVLAHVCFILLLHRLLVVISLSACSFIFSFNSFSVISFVSHSTALPYVLLHALLHAHLFTPLYDCMYSLLRMCLPSRVTCVFAEFDLMQARQEQKHEGAGGGKGEGGTEEAGRGRRNNRMEEHEGQSRQKKVRQSLRLRGNSSISNYCGACSPSLSRPFSIFL